MLGILHFGDQKQLACVGIHGKVDVNVQKEDRRAVLGLGPETFAIGPT